MPLGGLPQQEGPHPALRATHSRQRERGSGAVRGPGGGAMIRYIIKRLGLMVPTLILIMAVGFGIMQLPATDFVDQYVLRQAATGNTGMMDQAQNLKTEFGLDKPPAERFVLWVGNFAKGDFGISFQDLRPVGTVIMERLPATLAVSFLAFVVSWGVGIPLGVFSATHQYSAGDVGLTIFAFIGVGMPDFLLAIVLLVTAFVATGHVFLGLGSPEFVAQPWSLAKVIDFLSYAWLSVLAVAFTGTALIMRVTRNNMLEELGKPYVVTLRAKGLPERVVIWKHVFRNALHPLVSIFGQVLAFLINGFAITSVVLNLPTIQTTYLQATLKQDLFLASTILVLIAMTVVVGNLISDVLLAWIDPRIRYD
jgi:peptide/nickel transport system permease protein